MQNRIFEIFPKSVHFAPIDLTITFPDLAYENKVTISRHIQNNTLKRAKFVNSAICNLWPRNFQYAISPMSCETSYGSELVI